MKYERIPTDSPIRHVWARLSLLSSFSGARALLARHAQETHVQITDELLDEKAKGLAFCVRSASDYFRVPLEPGLTSSCLAYYYGAFSLMKAWMLSQVANSVTLAKLEEYTMSGHGLATVSNPNNPFPQNEHITILGNGFISQALKMMEYEIGNIAVQKRYKKFDELASQAADLSRSFTVQALLSRIPELRELYVAVFREHPNCVSFVQSIEQETGAAELTFNRYQNSEFLDAKKIREIFGWDDKIELAEDSDSNCIRTVSSIPHAMISAKRAYRSVMAYDSYIAPLAGIEDTLVLNFMLLYVLSIWVRYRPALWREIIEGEFDLYRPLFLHFLFTVERVFPNQVLNRIYNTDFHFVPFAYLS